MNRFIGAIEAEIVARGLIPDGATVLVAVSGGVDSVVLLDVLHRLAPRHGWRLVIGHFNHQLRGRASGADERFVRRLAARLGWPVVIGRAPVARRAKRDGVSREMAAREARHEFLANAARAAGARVIALAHQAEDQAELVLLRLLRGAASDGLGAMRWSGPSPADRRVTLVRPLLGRTKAELREHLRNWGLNHRDDASNADRDILRNRVRSELLPLLQEHYQPGVIGVLGRVAELLGAESDHLAAEAKAWGRQSAARGRSSTGTRGGEGATPAAVPFEALSVAVQRRVLVEQLLQKGLEPRFEWVEALRRAVGTPVTVGGGQRWCRDASGRLRRLRAARPLRRPRSRAEGRGEKEGKSGPVAGRSMRRLRTGSGAGGGK